MSDTLEDFIEANRHAVVLGRMRRRDEVKWASARSWFGGSPRIEPDCWPRSTVTGLPLHFLVQIDLTDLPLGPLTPTLPQQGSLAFFIDSESDGRESAACIYVSGPADPGPTDPPEDSPVLCGHNWRRRFRSAASPEQVPKTFPRWPIEFHRLPDLANDSRFPKWFGELGLKPIHHMDIETTDVPVDGSMYPWDTVYRLIGSMQQGHYVIEKFRHNRLPGKDQMERDQEWKARYDQLQPYRDFVGKWLKILEGRDRWAPMGQEHARMLAEVFSDIEFRRLPIGQGGVSFGAGTDAVTDAARDSYREMMWAEESIFMRIPAALRQKLVTDRVRASSGHWHQMFGQGIQIQSGLDGNADEVLLLQLGSDDMLSWMWYDVGLVHFWISPDDLAAGNWDAVKMTGEGH